MERVLLYGAGVRAQLFLKDRAMKISKNLDGRVVVGFVDDESSLHFQWVYGLLVLGGLKELPSLIERQKISRIIIVSELQPESRKTVEKIAGRGSAVERMVSGRAPGHPAAIRALNTRDFFRNMKKNNYA
jgi:FlaA1/EpsC-like NDP-sugar epimerase